MPYNFKYSFIHESTMSKQQALEELSKMIKKEILQIMMQN